MLIAQYELLGRVSQTGRGSVWKGWDNTLQREVALKQVIAPSVQQREQLRAEASALAGLQDENIVAVYDLVEESDDAWLVQEWVDGVSLRTISEHNPDLTPQQGLSICRGALLGLAFAHQQQFVHGDVSPANILVDVQGISMLIDFGLAGRWGTPSLGGTPGFASPEALEQQQLAPTSDVYSAGVVLAGVLLHRPLFGGSDVVAVLAQQRLSPDLSGLPAALEQVLSRSLAMDPRERQADASVLLRELDAAAERTYGPGWAVVGGVAGLVSATMAAVAMSGQATTLGTAAVAGAASPTGFTATVTTSTAASTASGVGSQVTGLGSTGAGNAGINFVSGLSNTTGGGAASPAVDVSLVKTVAADSGGSSTVGAVGAVGAGGAAKTASTVAQPLVLVAAAAAVVVAIVVAAVFLFGGGDDPQSLGGATETVAGSAPVITSGAEPVASTNSAGSAAQSSTGPTTSTSTSTTSSSTSTTSSAETTPESAAVLPANPALGFNGVYSYSQVVTAGAGNGVQSIGITQNVVWDVTTTCDGATCTAAVKSSSGRTFVFSEAGGEWKSPGSELLNCVLDDTGAEIDVQVPHSYERILRVSSTSNGHFDVLQGEFSETQTEPCPNQVQEMTSVSGTIILTYLGADAAMTLDPTPVTQTT